MLHYAITDRRLLATGEPARRQALLIQAAALARSGSVQFLQLREKDLSIDALTILAAELRATLQAHAPDPATRPRLLINTHAEAAIAARADGVHLPSATPFTPADIRHRYAVAGLPAPILSLSCHTLEDVGRATEDLANTPDVILFGPVFEKRANGHLISPGLGLHRLAEACSRATPLPVLALGGITADNTPACLEAGAAGIAAIRLFQSLPT